MTFEIDKKLVSTFSKEAQDYIGIINDKVISEYTNQNKTLSDRITNILEPRIKELEWDLKQYKQQLFGKKSERFVKELNSPQEELPLKFSEEPTEIVQTTITVPSHTRKSNKTKELPGDVGESGLRFLEGVPVKEDIKVPEEINGLDESQYEVISTKIRDVLCQEPGSYFVKRTKYITAKVKDAIVTPKSVAVIPGSYLDVSFLAGMLVDKFQYHQPLYRLHQRLKSEGIIISRQVLTNAVHRLAELLLPIYGAQLGSVLSGSLIAMDETPVKAGHKGESKSLGNCYYWVLYGDKDEVVFHFANTRSRDEVESLLKDCFTGTLLSDGYSAYESYAKKQNLIQAGCWAHTRRNFFKCEEYLEYREYVLSEIQKLYVVEEEIRTKNLSPPDILERRGQVSKEVVGKLFHWLKKVQEQEKFLPSSSFGKAIKYALKREGSLRVYLSDPNVPIDTNHLERALRVIPMGRKNWLFNWTEVGGKAVGIIQSLISTCKIHGVNPYHYLVDVLTRVQDHSQLKVHELTPRVWAESQSSKITQNNEQVEIQEE